MCPRPFPQWLTLGLGCTLGGPGYVWSKRCCGRTRFSSAFALGLGYTLGGLANHKIQTHAKTLGRGSIGSTVVALLAYENRYLCYWSGDSRAYLQRGESIRQVTKDHTEVQALLDAGTITPTQAVTWPRRNVITRALGVTLDPEVEMIEGHLQDRDLFLLCSDGLTEYFDIEELSQVLTMREWDLAAKCRFLVSQAVERGGKDNVSVILVRAKENGRPEIEIDGHNFEIEGQL